MVIVGLVGMHTLSAGSISHGTNTGNHGTVVPTSSSVPAHLDAGTLESVKGSPGTCDDACKMSDPQPLHHTDVMMACALALLVGFIFLFPVFLMYRTRMIPRKSLFVSIYLRHHSLLPRPPSLIVLSISRT
ncbi:DUF6153 family protein [Leucobacter sp. W1478]|uniref:DUF6153 family protein n=1 Tax=Leucobacter sp. W1478 TaxID=3439065 RepID=UPI003F30F06B